MAAAPDSTSIDPPTAPSGQIPIADYLDSGGKKHQAVVIESQSGNPGDDPAPLGASNPMPVTVVGGTVPAGTDASGFNVGTSQGLPALGVCNDSVTLTQGQQGVHRLTSSRAIEVSEESSSTGGLTPFCADSTSGTPAPIQVKTSQGKVGSISTTNTGTTWAYLRFWDSASTPAIGTAPTYKVGIPPNGGNNQQIPAGLQFNSGIWCAVTGAYTNGDTTPVAAGQVSFALGIK